MNTPEKIDRYDATTKSNGAGPFVLYCDHADFVAAKDKHIAQQAELIALLQARLKACPTIEQLRGWADRASAIGAPGMAIGLRETADRMEALMTAEITAKELAEKAVDMFGEGERVESWLTGAQEFLILTRAYAALQAERQKVALADQKALK